MTHTKGHYGWKNPYQILKVEEAIKEDSEDKCHSKGKHQKNANSMGMRNKRIHMSNLVTVLWSDI